MCAPRGNDSSMGYYATKEYNPTYSVLLTLWKGSKDIEENNNYNNDAPQHVTTLIDCMIQFGSIGYRVGLSCCWQPSRITASVFTVPRHGSSAKLSVLTGRQQCDCQYLLAFANIRAEGRTKGWSESAPLPRRWARLDGREPEPPSPTQG